MRLLGLKKRNEKKHDYYSEPLCSDPCGDYLLRAGGYCKLLQETGQWNHDAVAAAREMMKRDMAFVPAGPAVLHDIAATDGDETAGTFVVEEVDFFVDRCAVTNAQFKRFVDADAYRDASFWPVQIQPYVFQFNDRTDTPGPATWSNGCYDADKRDHPVVGISWHEANAYANWVGKRLPTSSQWQRAGTWWNPEARYPWGSSFADGQANTFAAGIGDTLPVDCYAEAAAPNGVLQLVGNVWEWIDASIAEIQIHEQTRPLSGTFGEIRGGAYDTYFATQASCTFRSGQPLLARNNNVGFRCMANSQLLS